MKGKDKTTQQETTNALQQRIGRLARQLRETLKDAQKTPEPEPDSLPEEPEPVYVRRSGKKKK